MSKITKTISAIAAVSMVMSGLAIIPTNNILDTSLTVLAAEQTNYTVSLSAENGYRGDEIQVQVSVETLDESGIFTISIPLSYDTSVLEFKSIENLTPNGLNVDIASFNPSFTSGSIISIESKTMIPIKEDGAILSLTFEISSNAAFGSTNITIPSGENRYIYINDNDTATAADETYIGTSVEVLKPDLAGDPVLDNTTPKVGDTIGVSGVTTEGAVFQWFSSADGTYDAGSDTQLTEATAAKTYTIAAADVNKYIICVASHPDHSSKTVATAAAVAKGDITCTTLPTIAAITYGQELNDAVIDQATDVTSVEGMWAIKNGTTKPDAGTYTNIAGIFTPTDEDAYNSLEVGNLSLTVNPAVMKAGATASKITLPFGKTLTGATYGSPTVITDQSSTPVVGGWDFTDATTPQTTDGTYALTFTPETASNYTTTTFSATGELDVVAATPGVDLTLAPATAGTFGDDVIVTVVITNTNAPTYTTVLPACPAVTVGGSDSTFTATVNMTAGATPGTYTGTFTIPAETNAYELLDGEKLVVSVAAITADDNYSASEIKTEELTVNAKIQAAITATDKTITYGEDASVTPTKTGDGIMSVTLDGTPATYTGSGAFNPGSLNAGAHTVVFSTTETDEYKSATKQITITVNKKPVTVTPPVVEIPYNAVIADYIAANPITATPTGFLGDDKFTTAPVYGYDETVIIDTTVVENIGQVYENAIVKVTDGVASDNYLVDYSAKSSITIVKRPSVIADADVVAPEVEKTTTTAITLKTVEGYEYSKDNAVWQDTAEFTGLSANTSYTLYQRVATTATDKASAAKSLAVKTEPVQDNTPPAPPENTGGNTPGAITPVTPAAPETPADPATPATPAEGSGDTGTGTGTTETPATETPAPGSATVAETPVIKDVAGESGGAKAEVTGGTAKVEVGGTTIETKSATAAAVIATGKAEAVVAVGTAVAVVTTDANVVAGVNTDGSVNTAATTQAVTAAAAKAVESGKTAVTVNVGAEATGISKNAIAEIVKTAAESGVTATVKATAATTDTGAVAAVIRVPVNEDTPQIKTSVKFDTPEAKATAEKLSTATGVEIEATVSTEQVGGFGTEKATFSFSNEVLGIQGLSEGDVLYAFVEDPLTGKIYQVKALFKNGNVNFRTARSGNIMFSKTPIVE